MTELTPADRLQPSLLDRLTDDQPKRPAGEADAGESHDGEDSSSRAVRDGAAPSQVITSRQLRELVKRDLTWLLNTSRLESSTSDLEGYPLVSESVINYGIPELTGLLASNIDPRSLEAELTDIIYRFEPRIVRHSLSVRVETSDVMGRNALRFSIECDVWGQPSPEHMYLFSELDLETRQFSFEGAQP
ncbi:MAG: type VI secretion system baseplate subunit TssE [Pseudomonadota bacterium]